MLRQSRRLDQKVLQTPAGAFCATFGSPVMLSAKFVLPSNKTCQGEFREETLDDMEAAFIWLVLHSVKMAAQG